MVDNVYQYFGSDSACVFNILTDFVAFILNVDFETSLCSL